MFTAVYCCFLKHSKHLKDTDNNYTCTWQNKIIFIITKKLISCFKTERDL